jgi:translation initiation factor 3 subunit E
MAARRDAVVAVWEENASNLGPLLALVEGTETGGAAPMVKMLADGSFTAAKLLADHEVGPEHAEALFHWAKFRFECGNYAETVGYMKVPHARRARRRRA